MLVHVSGQGPARLDHEDRFGDATCLPMDGRPFATGCSPADERRLTRRGHRGGMPMVDRHAGSEPLRWEWSGGDASIGSPAPPGDLLPSGGVPAPAPAPASHRALALDALRVLRMLRDHPSDAGPWGGPAFAREVDHIRDHLAPIVSRRGLAASYGREAHRRRGADRTGDTSLIRPVVVAYALRWMELGDGAPRPRWSDPVTASG
jgi:hypothetical protein